MSDTTYNKFQHYGTNAERLAFVPSPPAGTKPIYIWYETDTAKFYIYTTAWFGPFAATGVPGVHAPTHSSGGTDPVTLTNLAGFPGGTTTFLRADGTFVAPSAVAAAHAVTHQPGGTDAMAVDAIAATGSLRTLGTAATQATAGNDTRLTNARTPTAHATTHSSGGSDAVSVLNLGGYPGGSVNYLRADGTFAAPPGATITRFGAAGIIIDGNGSVITTGLKGYLEIPFACTIRAVTLLADVSGSIVVDIWKDTYANYPPTVADTITAAAKPTITTAIKSQNTSLTGWTTAIAAGDILGFNVNSVTTITRVSLSLKIEV